MTWKKPKWDDPVVWTWYEGHLPDPGPERFSVICTIPDPPWKKAPPGPNSLTSLELWIMYRDYPGGEEAFVEKIREYALARRAERDGKKED